MNNKKWGFVILLFSVFILISMLVLFVIGGFSDYLITKGIRITSLIFMILSSISLIFSIVLMIKNKKRRFFKKFKVVIISIFLSLYVIGCVTFLFLLYGPNHSFRDWLITTAMATMNHQYYCKWFYNTDMINETLAQNVVIESNEDTDPSLIDKNISDNKEYENDYERQVLEHDEDDKFKIVNFKVNDCNAYLAIVYDPSIVKVGVSRYIYEAGQYVSTMAKYYKSPLAINGGGFEDTNHNSKGGNPIGVTISSGKIITDDVVNSPYGIIGLNKDDVLVLTRNKSASTLLQEGIRDAVTMGPFLIVNGKKSIVKGNGGWGYAARTAIGQRADGIILMLVVDSNEFRTKGASMKDLADIMENYGAVNASNLDGGTSSVMSLNGEIINDPIDSTLAHKTRGIPTIFMIKE